MGLLEASWVLLLCWVLSPLCFRVYCDASGPFLKFSKAPRAFSHLNTATFSFEVYESRNGVICTNCTISCQLDDGNASTCEGKKVFYSGLQEGSHKLLACAKRTHTVGCLKYNWTVDTVPPTAYVAASNTLTNALNVSVNITFSEPCTVGGDFGCRSVNACNLLVYGAGQVVPSSLQILQPSIKYSLLVDLSSSVQFGRVILVMDRNFCSDRAGNNFTRSENSLSFVHFDRRNVLVNLRTHIPEKLLQLNSETRTVLATNDFNDLGVYIYFSSPICNTSTEVLHSLNVSQGSLHPVNGESNADRRFGFRIADISNISIVTLRLDSASIASRQGTPVSAIAPVTFLYDSQRPAVRLSTKSRMRTREDHILVLIKFMKPVFSFNSSCLLISGGKLQSFHEVSRSTYMIEIQADGDTVTASIPENVTVDVAGNKNLASNVLQLRHYSVPLISSVISFLATIAFGVTSVAAGLLTVSTSSLQTAGAFLGPSSSLTSDPARSLFRIACYIQIFALSRWLAVTLPVEYLEFTRGLQWSIPYFSLPWENGHIQQVMVGPNPAASSHSYIPNFQDSAYTQRSPFDEDNLNKVASLYRLPLTPMEYKMYLKSEDFKPEAEYIMDSRSVKGWRDFNRSMFWLAVIGGSLVFLHASLLLILKLRKKNTEKGSYGALAFPRFEIFLVILSLPCISEASAALMRGGASSGVVAGALLLGGVFFLLLALLLFLSVGITLGKLLQYKEVHQVGQKFHWYEELVRVCLGPGKRGQWTWKNQSNSVYLTILGPLFEDLRGPPKYMLSQISGGHRPKEGDSIIASDDETEDAEAPFIQKLFGILRIYYSLLESVKRVALGIIAGAYSDDWFSSTPTITLLCIISFQLFFLVLKKPFIKKKVQLVEIISLSSEVGIFATCVVLLRKQFSLAGETKVGIFMLALFLLGFIPLLITEWYALYQQTKKLDPRGKSFLSGLKMASIGFLQFFVPHKMMKNLERSFPLNNGEGEDRGGSASSGKYRSSGSRSSGSTDKPWLKQLRQLAKAGFSKDGSGISGDPSSSNTRWSGLLGSKRSGPSDFRSKDSRPNKLYKDLEAIFASK